MSHTDDPIIGLPSTLAATQVRINDLDQVADESISDSMNIAIDFPTQTLRMSWLQAQNAINPFAIPYQPSVGTLTTVGLALDQLRDVVASHVGMLIHTLSTQTPNALGYAGTWVQLPAGISIQSGATPNATPAGSNTPAVPMLQHSHTLAAAAATSTTTSTFTGVALPAHTHTYTYETHTDGGGVPRVTTASNGILLTGTTSATSAGTPTGTVASTTTTALSGTTDNNGVAAPTLDVRGAHIVAVIWRRTA